MTLSIKWVGPPRSYTEGRDRQLRYVTLHYTAGSEGPTSAESGAAYDKSRTDGTSCHYFVDSLGPAIQEVRDEDTSHSALYRGNVLGIHIEICGTAQTRAQWLDATSRATLQTAAELVAYLLTKHNLPNHRLSVAETRAAWFAPADERHKYEGYNDHGTITRAYPEDGGTHTDLGPNFPWDVFSAMVTEAMSGGGMDAKETCAAVWNTDGVIENVPGMSDHPANEFIAGRTLVARTWERVGAVEAQSKANGTALSNVLAAVARIEAALAAHSGDVTAGGEFDASGTITLTPKPAG